VPGDSLSWDRSVRSGAGPPLRSRDPLHGSRRIVAEVPARPMRLRADSSSQTDGSRKRS
jgi:hypothetical protein